MEAKVDKAKNDYESAVKDFKANGGGSAGEGKKGGKALTIQTKNHDLIQGLPGYTVVNFRTIQILRINIYKKRQNLEKKLLYIFFSKNIWLHT